MGTSPHAMGSRLRPGLLRLLAVIGLVLIVHQVARVAPGYFVVLAGAAVALAAGRRGIVPGLDRLARLDRAESSLAWILLVSLAVIGYLHNLNTWTPAGASLRPGDPALWKTELVLVIALAAPAAHGIASRLLRLGPPVPGRRLVTEFTLYVNFSGIALVLWTGDTALSLKALAALVVLILLAELSLNGGD